MANAEHLDKMIKKMTKKNSFENNCINVPRLKFRDLDKLLNSTKTLLLSEPALAVAKTPCVIVGDIHGQYGDLLKAFMIVRPVVDEVVKENNMNKKDNKDKEVPDEGNEEQQIPDEDNKGKKASVKEYKGRKTPGFASNNFIFLGDYVDRGPCSVECMTLLCLLKLRYPNRYTLLRGNHESREINRTYGFHAEIMQKYPDEEEAVKLYEMFNEVFDCLPLAALLGGRILCMHGGISKSMDKLEQINEIHRPLSDPLSSSIACDLLWADPVFGIKGYEPNTIRGVSDSFGEDVLKEFLDKHKLGMIVRGHQMMNKGFGFFCERRLVTVFTATSYYPAAKEPNTGAVMLVSKNGEFGFRMMLPVNNAKRIGTGWNADKFDSQDTAGDYRIVKRT